MDHQYNPDYSTDSAQCQEGIEEQEKEIEVPGFMLYRDAMYMLLCLSDEELGKVIREAVHYFLHKALPSFDGASPCGKDAFLKLRKDIDRSEATYRGKVARNRRNIRQRWRTRK